MKIPLFCQQMAKEWYFLLAKHCLEEFKLDCQLRRLTDRTIKGYYNNTLNFLIYAEKHHSITEVEEIYTLHIKHYVQYLLSKKLTAAYTNNILKCLRAYFRFAIQEEYIYSNPTLKVKMQREPKVLIKTFNDDEVRSLLSVFDYSTFLSARNKMVLAIAFDTGARNTENILKANPAVFNAEQQDFCIRRKARSRYTLPRVFLLLQCPCPGLWVTVRWLWPHSLWRSG